MKARNPPWTRDELILALDLYMINPVSPPGKTSPEIAKLSNYLNRLSSQLAGRYEKYRNPNGVYMKLMNFRRFDAKFREAGKVGLQRGGKLEEAIWNDYASDVKRLRSVATAIRVAIDDEIVPPSSLEEDDEIMEASEGRILTRLHRSRERNRKLVISRKAKALKETGRLFCDACGFDFEATYGPRGVGFIECHHVKPVYTLVKGTKTTLEDLVLLCANCHRMIHARQPWLSVVELRALIRNKP